MTAGNRARNLGRVGALLVSASIPAMATAKSGPIYFNIPAEPASKAIADFSRQAHIQVIAPTRQLHGIVFAGLTGNYEPGVVLDRLLSSSNLVTASDTGAVIVLRATPARSLPSDGPDRAPIPRSSNSAQFHLVSATQTAPAQDNAVVPAAPSAPPAEIVVTGSRLPSTFATPTPVTVLSAQDLLRTAPTGLDQALNQVPALAGSTIAQNSGSTTTTSGTNGQSLLDLRGLGPQRTLVLLDGQRVGPTNIYNSVDINVIPQALIKRVDIVTGGASASYGSDAVSGAVNFILDTGFKGLKLDVSDGITSRGDAPNQHVSIAFGHSFGDSTRVIGSFDYYRMKGIPYGHTGRNWYDHPTAVWPNLTGSGPSSIVEPDARSSVTGYGGRIISVAGCPAGAAGTACTALTGQQFVAGGALAPFDPGADPGTNFGSGGDGALVTNGLAPDIDRKSAFLHVEHDFGPNVTLWAEGIYSRNYTRNEGQVATQTGATDFTIYEGNPYLPAAVQAAFAATPGTQSFKLARYDADLSPVTVYGITTVKRGAAGLKGSLSSRWHFDLSGSYQSSYYRLDVLEPNQRNLYAAADAVVNPANGQIACRSTLQGLDPGCVPIDLFGTNTVSQAANAYVMGLNRGDTRINQATAEANLRGNLGDRLSLGAGPVTVAVGAAYRRLSAHETVDAVSDITLDGTGIRGFPTALQGRYGGYQYYNPSPLSGSVKVAEGYVELGLPILRDKPFFRALDATIAGRMTHYSQSGWEPTWKAGLNWTVNGSIRFRGTVSQDIRAPSVDELFSGASVSKGNNLAPYSGAPALITTTGQNISVGNPALKPERARTYTAGVILSPTFLPRFKASIDYYNIEVKDSILTLSFQQIVDSCYAGDQAACAEMLVNGQHVTTTTGITASDFVVVTSPYVNYAKEKTSGIDIESSYQIPLGSDRLALNFSGNYLLHAYVENTCAGDPDIAGTLGNCGDTAYPRFTAHLGADYKHGPFDFYVQERFISSGKKNTNFVEGVDINDNGVPATWYTDLNLTVDIGRSRFGDAQFYVNVTNLFDQDPRNTLERSRTWVETSNLGLYDALGRRFVAGFRIKL